MSDSEALPDDAALWRAGQAGRRLHRTQPGENGAPLCGACRKPWPCAGYVGSTRAVEVALHPGHAVTWPEQRRAAWRDAESELAASTSTG